MAYHPDCGWSKKAAIYWDELELWLRQNNLEDKIDLYTVNASEQRSLTSRGVLYGMGKFRGYPTIRLYYDSGEYINYEGEREKESIKAFLLANGVKPNKQ